jgi:hypothetical protein
MTDVFRWGKGTQIFLSVDKTCLSFLFRWLWEQEEDTYPHTSNGRHWISFDNNLTQHFSNWIILLYCVWKFVFALYIGTLDPITLAHHLFCKLQFGQICKLRHNLEISFLCGTCIGVKSSMAPNWSVRNMSEFDEFLLFFFTSVKIRPFHSAFQDLFNHV